MEWEYGVEVGPEKCRPAQKNLKWDQCLLSQKVLMQVLCPHSVKTSAKWFLTQRSNLTYTVVIALIHMSPPSSPSMQPYRGKTEFYPGPVPQPGSIPQPELLLSILNPYAWEGERGWGHHWGNQVYLAPIASGKKFLPDEEQLVLNLQTRDTW